MERGHCSRGPSLSQFPLSLLQPTTPPLSVNSEGARRRAAKAIHHPLTPPPLHSTIATRRLRRNTSHQLHPLYLLVQTLFLP